MANIEFDTEGRRQMTATFQDNGRYARYRSVHTAMTDIVSKEELEIHFTCMPGRYWQRATEESVCRHLQLIRQFCARLATGKSEATSPAVAWRQIPERNVTEVTICTWDRLGLLAKVAGVFAAAELNILRADVYTRIDNLALDIFEICDARGNLIANEDQLHAMSALLTETLRPGAKSHTAHTPSRRSQSSLPPKVYFDAEPTLTQTVVVIEAKDQIGLLHRVFTVLADCGINVAQAIITTEKGRVGDVLYVTDDQGRQITDSLHLDHIREDLLAAL
jgi:[protein-PII] uridylyltransferase